MANSDKQNELLCDSGAELVKDENKLCSKSNPIRIGASVLGLAAAVGACLGAAWIYSRPTSPGPLLHKLSFAEKATRCTDSAATDGTLESCCLNGGEAAYAVKREYENIAVCGHVQCGSGRLVGSTCTNRATDEAAFDTLHRLVTSRDLADFMPNRSKGRMLQEKNVVEFPKPQTLTASSNLMTTASPDIAKRETQQGQAYCAGSISGASIYSAGIGLQIASAVFYCTKEVTESAPQKCSRQIFAIVEDMAITAKYGLEAAEDCSQDADPCGIAVDDMLKRTFDMGVAASRMAEDCKRFIYAPGTINHFSCGGDLQKLVGNFPDFIGDIEEGMRQCKKVPETGFMQDYGLCVGGVMSVCGYIAGAALQLEYIPRSCGDPKTDKEKGPECSTTVAASLQSLAVAASATVDSASNCGGLDTDCGIDLSDLASSVFSVQSAFSNVATYCTPEDVYRHSDTVTKLTAIQDAECSDSITNGVQGLSVMAATALDAANSCAPGNDNADNNECGSGISKALGSFSFLAGQLAEAFMNCRHGALEYYGFYKCAANFERIANIADATSESIGDSVAHCGLKKGSDAAKGLALSPVQLPRRFFRNVR